MAVSLSKDKEMVQIDVANQNEGLLPPSKKRDVCQIDQISWLSFVSFAWMFGYMWNSFKKKLPDTISSVNELWTASIFDSANINLARLEHLWSIELKRNPTNPNFTRTVIHFFRYRLALSCLIFVFCIVFGFIGPTCIVRGLISFLEKPSINLADGTIDRSYGWALAFGMFFVEILRVLAYGATWAVSYRTAVRIRGAILALLYKHLANTKSTNGKTSAEIVNIYANDGQRIFDAVTFAPLVLVGPLVLIGGLVYLLRIIGPLSLVAIGVFLVFDVFQAIFGIVMVKCRNLAIVKTEERMGLLGEIIACIRTIKFNAWEELFFNRVNDVRKSEIRYLRIAGYAQSLAVASGSIVPVVATIVMVLSTVYSGYDLLASDAFSAITVFFVMLFGIRMIPYGIRYLAEARQALQRIRELLLLETYDTHHPAPHLPRVAINMRNCTFSWSPSPADKESEAKRAKPPKKGGLSTEDLEAVPLKDTNGNLTSDEAESQEEPAFRLKNLNLSIEKGELIGVCGVLGSGKTALLNAIIGHMSEERGKLEIGGTLALCPQTPCILNDTIRENILFGHPMNAQRYYRALCCAQLNHDLERLPSNEQSRVSAGQLSGGQRARISIARALYSNRDIYLFDDVFSSVDGDVAASIFKAAIKDMLSSKTVIFVTNDPNYLSECDRILFLEKGAVNGLEKHENLLNSSMTYREFFESLQRSTEASRRLSSPPKAASNESANKSPLKTPKDNENPTDLEKPEDEENYGSKAVKAQLYLEYAKAGGGYVLLTFLLFTFLFNVGSNIFASYWLSKWMKDVHREVLVVNGESQSTSRVQYTRTLANSEDLGFYTSIYAFGLFVLLFSGVLKAVIFVKFTLDASTRFHNRMLKRMLYAISRFFNVTPTGQILNRFSKDVDELDVKLPFSAEAFLQCILTCIGFLLMIVWVFPIFLIPSAPIFCLFLLFVLCFRAGIRLLKRLENISRTPLFEHISFSLDNLSTIHTYGQTNRFVEHLKVLLDENTSAMFLYHSAMRWQAVWLDLLVVAITFIIALLIVFLTGTVSPPDAGLAISFALQMSGLFQFAVRSFTELEAKMTSVERISYYCKNIEVETADADPADLPTDWPSSAKIHFDDVILRYELTAAPALQNVTFTVEDGQKVGIAGRTGSGKSSLCNALFRMYPVDGGRVKIDSRDIASVSLKRLRRSMVIIPQEPTLFAGTLRFNLDPLGACSDAQIWECLNQIELLDEGANHLNQQKLEFQVDASGLNLSSGQRQLICLARALLRNTRIIVLDEATSNIDLQTDEHLRRVLKKFSAGKTILLITHRLENIADVDSLFEMEDGKLSPRIASGTPNSAGSAENNEDQQQEEEERNSVEEMNGYLEEDSNEKQ